MRYVDGSDGVNLSIFTNIMIVDHFDKPLGGTEIMYNELMRRLPDRYKEEFSIFNYPNGADFIKKKIYWNQLSYDQDAIQFLKEKQNIDNIDHFVFVSNWQAEKFRQIYNIPGEKTSVIKNAHLGISGESNVKLRKSDRIIKVCYTSTPWRGLDVLLKAWEMIKPINCELHVFSSCKIYGKDFAQEDSKYEFLYDWCERLPNVIYHGSIPNNQLRGKLTEFEILAYPNTFEETSCISVIEAISAGLRVVTTSLGALPETTEGNATIYPYVDDRNKHSEVFAEVLGEEIDKVRHGYYREEISNQRLYYRKNWSWDERINDWIRLLNKLSDDKLNLVSNYFEPKAILDIGSNVGQFYMQSNSIYPDAYYYLIEGNDNCEEDIKKLGVDYKISLLSDVEKDVDFHISKNDKKATGNSIYIEDTSFYDETNGDIVSKKTETLDNIFKDHRWEFDLIKIDTQGSEIDIINGGSKLVRKAKGLILEVSHKEYNKGSMLYREVIYNLSKIGFIKAEILDKIYHPITKEHIQDDILFINKKLIKNGKYSISN